MMHKPKHAVALFSGGYDSLVTTHLTMSYMERYYPKLPRFVAHINTGIGIEETRTFVRETCKQYGWTLKEYTTEYNYDDLAMEYGFPGPAMHGVMYIKLKERPIVINTMLPIKMKDMIECHLSFVPIPAMACYER
jgi:tRNA(Ile)-lysidine synthase TilS/MesJ